MISAYVLLENVQAYLERHVLIQINTPFIQKPISEWVNRYLVKCKKQGYPVATLPGLARALPFDPTLAVSWAVGMGDKGYE